MSIARLVVIAAVTAVSGITAGGAHAEECPQWLKWVCSSDASPNAVATQDAGQNKQISRTKPASHSAIGGKAKTKKPQQATRAAQSHPAIGDDAEQELFQAFLEWDTKRRLNGETNR